MVIDVPKGKGFVIDTDKKVPKTKNSYVIYFSKDRAKQLGVSNDVIDECMKDSRHRIALCENCEIKEIIEEQY